MTIPFSQVRGEAIKLKVTPSINTQLLPGAGIRIDKPSPNKAQIAVDFSNLERDDIASPNGLYVGTWDAENNIFKLVKAEALKGGPPILSGTSSTSNAIGTGSKSFTTQTGLGFAPGMALSVSAQSDASKSMSSHVTSYDIETGALVLNVSTINGSGTFSAWDISLVGDAVETWLKSGSNVYYNNGRVGIGNASPATPVHVGSISNSNSSGRIRSATANNDLSENRSFDFGVDADAFGNYGFNISDVIAGRRFTIGTDGKLQLPAYGAGLLSSDSSGNVTAVGNPRLQGAVYVQDYCACDGVTNDTSGLIAAYNATPSGGMLIFPGSNRALLITSGLVITKPIYIQGNHCSIYDNTGLNVITLSTASGNLPYVTIDGLWIQTSTIGTSRGIVVSGANDFGYSRITDCTFLGSFYDSIAISARTFHIQIDNCQLQGYTTNIRQDGEMGQSVIANNRMGTGASGSINIFMAGTIGDNIIIGNQCEGFNGGTGTYGLRLDATGYGQRFQVTGNKFDTSQYGIAIAGVTGSSFIGNGLAGGSSVYVSGSPVANNIAAAGGNIFLNNY